MAEVEVEYVSLAKQKAFAFIKSLCQARGYQTEPPVYERFYQGSDKCWKIRTKSPDGHKVLAVCTNVCKVNSDELEVDDEVNDSKLSANKLTEQLLESILDESVEQKVKWLILIGDNIKPKQIGKRKGVQLTHFTYEQACVGDITQHMYQPKEVIRVHQPRSDQDCQPVKSSDIFVRFKGFVKGDLLQVTHHHGQVEFWRVV